ncbi:type II toxin-antitoxin system VapC family toxin [Candidatus Shapirobacteria bacterium]|nr:type II toxin-antitoxin system VapC family toxin [Candidatus Shapirobacteria bacterium]
MAQRRPALKPATTVFLDSSVLFTAVNSPIGGSAKLFTLSKIKLVTSPLVLAEVERNVRKKLQGYHRERFFKLAAGIKIVEQRPDDRLIQQAQKFIVEKDAVILAEAKNSKADFLVTLDKKHFLQESVKNFLSPQKVLAPKGLLEMAK